MVVGGTAPQSIRLAHTLAVFAGNGVVMAVYFIMLPWHETDHADDAHMAGGIVRRQLAGSVFTASPSGR